ncbi:hypothetical protein LOZ39_004625 [Ophidiomyces ophidiicola]|nr:hypothetical protein LOZ61_004180 [Ophidiomyces ophidiicola]KAI1959163.1 hypothetical protein LOZ59_003213 [Ophidiomyces ophidiicola]KAI1974364.1 hypothetical protein LOZ55_005063 [Ophidiomyces ophidiicola]KAI1982647.1 hypothetical protein LOZ54_005333 [Ophidiomyces ophidiicola]KAI2020187.1 hypothetical protein LOZ45_005209 [Ophidiomyces ophidiicola]
MDPLEDMQYQEKYDSRKREGLQSQLDSGFTIASSDIAEDTRTMPSKLQNISLEIAMYFQALLTLLCAGLVASAAINREAPAQLVERQFPSGGFQFSGNGAQFPSGGFQFPGNGAQFPSGGFQFPGNGAQVPSGGPQSQQNNPPAPTSSPSPSPSEASPSTPNSSVSESSEVSQSTVEPTATPEPTSA